MKALVQLEAGGELILQDIPIPTPGKGEVLVKMDFAQINPSDLSFLNGSYAEKPEYPAVPGIEGSGTVVKSGGGFIPRIRLGKKVSCTKKAGNTGSWAEYMVTNATNVIPLGYISSEQGAGLIVNPLTAIAFMDIAKRGGHKAIFNNAAGGALGMMLVRLCKSANINLISIVRTEKQKEIMQSGGAKNVLNSSTTDYLDDLNTVVEKLSPTLFLDAIGGEQTKIIIDIAPENSVIMPYANLSESDSYFNSRALLQKKIKIDGFFLGQYSHDAGLIKVMKNISRVKKLINTSLKSEIRAIIKPEEASKAIIDYSNQMSGGKILIDFREKQN